MINDVLEQIAEDYFRHQGYFTQHNVKYKPHKTGPAYAVHSDVDIVGIHPNEKGIKRVIVASCKSWYGGLHIEGTLRHLHSGNKKARKTFREIAMLVWSKALKQKIKAITGQDKFIFYLICTKYDYRTKYLWEQERIFRRNLKDCGIKLLDMKTMIQDIQPAVFITTPAHSELSRLLQMIHHSGGIVDYKN